MLSDKHAHHIRCLVPAGLSGHLVIYMLTVYHKVVECDPLHLADVVITYYEREIRTVAVIYYILEENILYQRSRGSAIFFVPGYPDINKMATAEILHPDVVEGNVLHYVVRLQVNQDAEQTAGGQPAVCSAS